MAVWADAILSDAASIEKFEGEINSLTSTNWDNAIAIAKELIGDKLEVILINQGIAVDEAGGEILLDVIANPTVFNISSDYFVLYLIYEDLSQGSDGLYMMKAEKYIELYQQKFNEDIKRMNLDIDLDDTTDIYRVNWQGGWSR